MAAPVAEPPKPTLDDYFNPDRRRSSGTPRTDERGRRLPGDENIVPAIRVKI